MTDIGLAGAAEAIDLLDVYAARAGNVAPVVLQVREAFLEVEQRRFDAEGPDWAGLADSTLAHKRARGYPDDILHATGALERSLTQADAPGAVFVPVFAGDATSVTLGTDLKPASAGRGWEDTALGAFHQYGTRRMPARPVIDDTAELAVEWTDLLGVWLSTGAASAVHV